MNKTLFSRNILKFVVSVFWVTGTIPATYARELEKTQMTEITQQNITVEGKVTDALGEPIIGASVQEKGTTNGIVTDIDGRFSLSVESDATLIISFIGFQTQEVKAAAGKTINIVLKEDTEMLDEVVVVGFGTQKKVNLTGSVGTATSKELADRPVMLASQALQGLVPGLTISQNNGNLGARASIKIRGTGTIGSSSSGSPLILIDGMEGDINALNPQDIENISVLKDASASSIYGSRAPFGVILITTKKGTPGKTSVSYSNSFRWNKPLALPKFMDSYTFATYFNDASINNGWTPHFTDAWLANILAFQKGEITTTTVPNPNTGRWEEGFDPNGAGGTGGNDNRDYYREIFRTTAESQEHNFSINGGNEKVTYYTSFNFLTQDGLMVYNQDQYERYSATAKIGYNATDWLRVNYSNRFIREKYHHPSSMNKYLYRQIGMQGWPMLPLYDPNGHMLSRWALSLKDGGTNKSETDNSYQQIQFEFEPIKNWKTFAEVNYSIMNYDLHSENFVTYMYDLNENPYAYSTNSGVSEGRKKENYLNFNLYSEYSFTLEDKHNFKGLIGMQIEKMKQTQYGLSRDGILFPGVNEIDGTTGTDYWGAKVDPYLYGSRNRWATLGYFARINYDYEGRYLAELSIRDDGSSRFRSGNRYVWSPSFSLGWNISQEKFWKPLEKTINLFKIRGSYGQLANQNTHSWYPTYAAMGISSSGGYWLQNGLKPNIAWAPGTLVNTNQTWEKIRTMNLGADFGLFSNRLTGSFDYYIRKTKDMLGPAPERPVTLGVGVPQANNTDLKDYGFELQISWRDRLQNGLGYGVKFTLSDYQTVIERYPNETNYLGTYIAGQKTGQIWGYETVGIAKTQAEMDAHLASLPHGGQNALGSNWQAGDIMYKDLNGDGKISSGSYTLNDSGDMKVIGNTTPRYQVGFELTADWKGFDFRAFFQGILKRDYWQGSYFFFGAHGGGMWWSTGFTEHLDYFRDENTTSVQKGVLAANPNSYYPRALFDYKNQNAQTRYLQDASYIRMKNLQLGYTLPATLTRKFGVNKLRVYVSGENLFTLTGVKSMFDPETIDAEESGDNDGWGGSVYPLSRVFSVGLNINF